MVQIESAEVRFWPDYVGCLQHAPVIIVHSWNNEDDPQLSCWLPKLAGFSRRLLAIDHKVVENCLPGPENNQNVESSQTNHWTVNVCWVGHDSWFARCHWLLDEFHRLKHPYEFISAPVFSDFKAPMMDKLITHVPAADVEDSFTALALTWPLWESRTHPQVRTLWSLSYSQLGRKCDFVENLPLY